MGTNVVRSLHLSRFAPPMNRMNRKLTDLFLAQLFPLVSSVLMTFATAIILGVSKRGELAIVIASSSLIGALGFLSLQVGIVRAYRMGDLSAERRGSYIAAILAIIVFALGIAIAFLVPNVRVGLFDRPKIIMIACGAGLVIFNLVVLRTRQGLGDSRVYRDASLIVSLIFPILGIPLALATREPMPVVFSWYFALICSSIFALRRIADRSIETPLGDRVPTSEILKTSIVAHIGVAGQQLLHSADMVILGSMASATAVGIYSVAVPIAGLIWMFSEALSLIAFDSGSRRASLAQHHVHRLELMRLNLVFGLIGAIFIGLGSMIFLPLLLPKYSAAVPLVILLLPGVLIQGYARIGLSSILVSGSKRTLVTIGVASMLLSGLYVPFVRAFGATGAAVSSSIIYILQTIVVFLVIRRLMRKGSNEAHAVNY
jgi:O-antigen/teichoic acid export membrane protein